MQYLVTGATGLLGNNIVRELLARGQSVRVLARERSDPRPLAGLAVERAAGDVRDRAAVEQAMAGVDAVIHSAGHVHIGWSQRELAEAINVEGTRNVAQAARASGARLVHVSTTNAVGLGTIESPADEENWLPGIVECPYVSTKRAAEQVVREEVGRGLHGVIVNPAFMLAPWDWKPSSGKMLLEVTRFAPFAPLGATSVCDARDVAAAAITAADRGRPGERYILGGENLSYWELWRRMAALVGKRGPRLPMGPIVRGLGWPGLVLKTWLTGEGAANTAAMAMGRQTHCFSSAKAARELGYSSRPLATTLADTWSWFQAEGYVRK